MNQDRIKQLRDNANFRSEDDNMAMDLTECLDEIERLRDTLAKIASTTVDPSPADNNPHHYEDMANKVVAIACKALLDGVKP